MTSLSVTVAGLAELTPKLTPPELLNDWKGFTMAAYLLGRGRSSQIISKVRYVKSAYLNTHSNHLEHW